MGGRQVIVTLLEQIDGSNAGQVRRSLHGVINHGATIVTADTTSANGTALLLVVPGPIMRQVLSLNGPTAWSPSAPSWRRPRRPQRKYLCCVLLGGPGQDTTPRGDAPAATRLPGE